MRSAVLAVLAATLLTPVAALAQSAPFAPLPQAPPQQSETGVAPAGAEEEGITALQQGALILAGVLLVLGIGFAIARDARRNAPGHARPAARGSHAGTAGGGEGERRKPDQRAAQKQKAAAKRARQARKKNRPVRK